MDHGLLVLDYSLASDRLAVDPKLAVGYPETVLSTAIVSHLINQRETEPNGEGDV